MELTIQTAYALAFIGAVAVALLAAFHGQTSILVWVTYFTIMLALVVPALHWQKHVWEQAEIAQREQANRSKPTQPELRAFLIPANEPTPTHSCGVIPSTFKAVFLGGSVITFDLKQKPFSIIMIANEDVLSIENAPSGIVLNAIIRDESNNVVATIKKNVFHSYKESEYEAKSPDQSSVLILDNKDQVILYVRYLNQEAIKVLGVFRHPDRQPVIVEEGQWRLGSDIQVSFCGSSGGEGTGDEWWRLKAAIVVE